MGVKFGISLTLRDRMRVYETNGTRCSARECRRLYNRELPALYCSPNITRMITAMSEMGGACGTHGREKGLEVGCGEET